MLSKYPNGEIAWQVKKYPMHSNETGALSVLEYSREFDFTVKRAFIVDSVNSGAIRGEHAHLNLKQLIVCLRGSFQLVLDSGFEKHSLSMCEDQQCVYLDGRVWREMKEFTHDAIMLVLCDRVYSDDVVVRDYAKFLSNIENCK